MDLLKKLWPIPFAIQKGDVVSLVVRLVIFLIACTVVGWLIGFLAGIPILGIIFGLVGSLLEIYSIVGIVLCVLKFLGTI
ncbi:MAG: hypothetical protein IKM59_04810 [Oscillospiraceae bacterium]|nr:hypothetical protein [Oscillospiraceae bacterium]